MYDAVVIGAGPAGLFASLRLAQSGLRVALLEEHQVIGDPVHCTGILAREAFDQFDLPANVILNELTTARFFSPSGLDVVYHTQTLEAVAIDRVAFDATLAERARCAGVDLRHQCRATNVQIRQDGVVVSAVGHADVRGRACVVASGGRYALHRRLGLSVPSLFLHTAQRELPVERPDDVEVHFGSHVAPRGFGWVVPIRRRDRCYARIGVMSEDRSPTYFERMVARVSERWRVRPVEGAPRQKILPLNRIARTYGERLLVVGDAAGLVKPTTGGGIYYSLVSASIAADVLTEAMSEDDLSANRLAEYERSWRARLEDELDTQLTFRTLAQQMPDEDIEGLFELARTDGVMPIVRRTATFNRHRQLIVALLKHPPARQLFLRSFL
jgi:digeranylgeranylglycerophospholipid reductase